MSRPIKNYNRCNVGYYVNYVIPGNAQPFQVVGTYSENTTETPSASYINDNWFKYITGLSTTPRPIIDGSSVTFAQNNISIIDDYILKNYSERDVFCDDFVTWCDYDFKPSNIYDISAPLLFTKIMRSRVRSLFENKRNEYAHLWEIQTAEFNPLNDYDYTEVVKHSGTDTTAHSGTDTTANTGSDVTRNTGTDTTAHSGIDTTAHSGMDTTAHSGKDTTQNSGTDTTTRTGSQSDAHTGTDTDTNSGTDTNTGYTYAFDSVSEVNKDKNSTTHGKQTQTSYNDTLTTTYNSVADATAHGLKSELTHGEQISLTHGESVSTTHGESIGLTHGKTTTLQHGLSQTITHGEAIGLTHGEKVEIEKHGSNMSPNKLLTEHREFWENFNLLQIIADDIAKAISV